MNTRNSYGMYDSPRLNAVREPLVFSQAEMQLQLEAGAFVLDKEEAFKHGLINVYDDDTDTVLVR